MSFYYLLTSSFYGKTIEQPSKRSKVRVRLCNSIDISNPECLTLPQQAMNHLKQ